MNKSFLEKRITEKAENRLIKEFSTLREIIRNNVFTKGLKIGVELVNHSVIFPEYIHHLNEESKKFSNMRKMVESRRQELIKEETDILFDKLESVKYLFD